MSPLKPQTTIPRSVAIHERLNQAQAYIEATIEALREYPGIDEITRLTAVNTLIDKIQHDFENRMLDEEAGI